MHGKYILIYPKVNGTPRSEPYMSKECWNLFHTSSTVNEINCCGTKYVCDKTEEYQM